MGCLPQWVPGRLRCGRRRHTGAGTPAARGRCARDWAAPAAARAGACAGPLATARAGPPRMAAGPDRPHRAATRDAARRPPSPHRSPRSYARTDPGATPAAAPPWWPASAWYASSSASLAQFSSARACRSAASCCSSAPLRAQLHAAPDAGAATLLAMSPNPYSIEYAVHQCSLRYSRSSAVPKGTASPRPARSASTASPLHLCPLPATGTRTRSPEPAPTLRNDSVREYPAPPLLNPYSGTRTSLPDSVPEQFDI